MWLTVAAPRQLHTATGAAIPAAVPRKTTPETPMFFSFREAARWNAERQAVELGVEIGEDRWIDQR
jgi:hypothetical protein